LSWCEGSIIWDPLGKMAPSIHPAVTTVATLYTVPSVVLVLLLSIL